MGILLLGAPPAQSPFKIVLSYDTSVGGAPQSFKDALTSAANILMATFSNPVTINLQVGYGTYSNLSFASLSITQTSAIGADNGGNSLSYSSIRAALDANKGSNATAISFVNALPNASNIQGTSNFYVPLASQKILGLNGTSPTAPGVDGLVGIGTSVPTGNLVGVALHEFTHAMGRETSGSTAPFDLGRFTAAGTWRFANGLGVSDYFSADGGTTKLADYGTASDISDFLDTGVQGANDPFNEHYTGTTNQTLSTAGIQQMNCLGYI